MGSVSSISPGLANLLQTLSNVNSPVVSSPTEMAALQKASPSDIAQLSVESTQLQSMDEMFGISTGSLINSGGTLNSTFERLEESGTGSAASATNTPASSSISPADELANEEAAFQGAETQGLVGLGSTSSASASLLNILA